MVASNSLLLAVLAIVVALVGTVSANVIPETKECMRVLSDSLAGAAISHEVHEFIQLVRFTLPGVAAEDYSTLERDRRIEKLEAAFPLDECNELLDQVDELTMKALEGRPLCRALLADDESDIMQLAKEDAVLSHVLEAKEACFAFPPAGKAH